MFKSQTKKIVINASLVFTTIIILSLASFIELSNGDRTTNSPTSSSGAGAILANGNVQSVSLPSIITPPPNTNSNEDDPNGDDGPAIKKDVETIENARTKDNKTNQIDKHQFYKPEYINDTARAMSYWVDFSKLPQLSQQQNLSTKHELLSKSHRRAAPIKLSFEFPFYGQPLKNIIIATGGFLYVGEHLHHWLAATQNISPLMANFDLSTSNYSDVHYYDNGTDLVVQWQNVQMKDNRPPGNFSFQVNLKKNGDIIFVYKHLAAPINEIPEDDHPVKVGISDAFLIDKVAFFIRRKTIYDYHRMNLKEQTDIGNQTAIYLKALPTCNQYDTCETCSKASSELECIWCPTVKRCSNGFDRKRQEWLSNSCDKITKSDCSMKATSPNDSNQQQSGSSSQSTSSSNQAISIDGSSSSRQMMLPNDRIAPESRVSEGGSLFVTFLMFMALTSGVALWVFYAYKNPHTPSGQMLIKYRPSNWRWQNAETRYTAASIHM